MMGPPKKMWAQPQKNDEKQAPKYNLIDPSIFFEFWGLTVLKTYFNDTESSINLFKEQGIEIPKDLQDQFDFLKNKIEKLEQSLQNNQLSYKKYAQCLLNSINRELSEMPCRSLNKLTDVKENIKLLLLDLLACCDDPTKSDLKRNDLFKLIEIPFDVFLEEDEMALFWGFELLNSFSDLSAFLVSLYAQIDSNCSAPKQISDLNTFYHTARDQVRNEYWTDDGQPNSLYIETLSQAIEREEKKKGALTSIQKHRIEVMRDEFDQLIEE